MAEIDILRALNEMGYYEANESDKEIILSMVVNENPEQLSEALEKYAKSKAHKEMSFLEWINSEGNNGR